MLGGGGGCGNNIFYFFFFFLQEGKDSDVTDDASPTPQYGLFIHLTHLVWSPPLIAPQPYTTRHFRTNTKEK